MNNEKEIPLSKRLKALNVGESTKVEAERYDYILTAIQRLRIKHQQRYSTRQIDREIVVERVA